VDEKIYQKIINENLKNKKKNELQIIQLVIIF
jgi:hypothetical protein